MGNLNTNIAALKQNPNEKSSEKENNLPTTEVRGLSIKFLNILENTILTYAHQHKESILNPYWFFAEKLGYKQKNYIYSWFETRQHSNIKLIDVKEIYRITKDQALIDALLEELTK